ncbi:hypothetical protein LY76DRAFT_178919 [Colletotrichum caudatum]|nr:hypothetical protein LY76DRAFT_178919 [Colletotrichum caudatum]
MTRPTRRHKSSGQHSALWRHPRICDSDQDTRCLGWHYPPTPHANFMQSGTNGLEITNAKRPHLVIPLPDGRCYLCPRVASLAGPAGLGALHLARGVSPLPACSGIPSGPLRCTQSRCRVHHHKTISPLFTERIVIQDLWMESTLWNTASWFKPRLPLLRYQRESPMPVSSSATASSHLHSRDGLDLGTHATDTPSPPPLKSDVAFLGTPGGLVSSADPRQNQPVAVVRRSSSLVGLKHNPFVACHHAPRGMHRRPLGR